MKSSVFNQYVDIVCDKFSISREDFFSKKNKSQKYVDARYILYYLCRSRNIKIVSIREYMSDNNYVVGSSPMLYGIRQVEKKIELDPDYKPMLEAIQKSVSII
jgi:chromosomal replication initiation ATPase DnaA